MSRLDGNVLAGRLVEVLGWDATTADARCAQCGTHGPIALAVVYATSMGTVARCPHCDGDRRPVAKGGLLCGDVRGVVGAEREGDQLARPVRALLGTGVCNGAVSRTLGRSVEQGVSNVQPKAQLDNGEGEHGQHRGDDGEFGER